MGTPFSIVNGWLTIHVGDLPRINLAAVTTYRPEMVAKDATTRVCIGVYLSQGGPTVHVSFPEPSVNLELLVALDRYFAQ